MTRFTIHHDGMRRAGLRNRVQAVVLLSGMAMTLGLCAWLIAGPEGLILTVVALAAAMIVVPSLSPSTIMRLHRAVPIEPWRLPGLNATLAELSRRAGLPAMPALYWMPEAGLNAFAVGTGVRSAIALSDGVLRMLDPREVEAVLAHEIAHIAAGDTGLLRLTESIAHVTRLTALLGMSASFLMLLANGEAVPLWVMVLFAGAPTAVTLLQLAFSRNREFAADLGAARLTGDPLAITGALERIDLLTRPRWPWGIRRSGGTRMLPPVWLRTHPPTRDRVARLLRHLEIMPQDQGRPERPIAPLPPLRAPSAGQRRPADGRTLPVTAILDPPRRSWTRRRF